MSTSRSREQHVLVLTSFLHPYLIQGSQPIEQCHQNGYPTQSNKPAQGTAFQVTLFSSSQSTLVNIDSVVFVEGGLHASSICKLSQIQPKSVPASSVGVQSFVQPVLQPKLAITSFLHLFVLAIFAVIQKHCLDLLFERQACFPNQSYQIPLRMQLFSFNHTAVSLELRGW